MNTVRTSYDPFNREEEAALDRERAAKAEHERWSLEQSRLGLSATQREPGGVWVKRVLGDVLGDEDTTDTGRS